VRSYENSSVTATYSGPLPGTLCYDGSCRQAAPGYYTAPPEEVIRTWTTSYPESCPPGYSGSATVTEYWQTVKYWTPSAGGLSSRGTLSFTSATRDEMVNRQTENNYVAPPPTTQPPPTTEPGNGNGSGSGSCGCNDCSCCCKCACRPPICCD